MKKKSSYSYEEIISCGNGKLFGPGNAKLPLPPMLMFDRISEISENTGNFKKGSVKAELDIKDNLWFFECHFKDDSVMPGCLGLDAMWQLVGFYLGWLGNPGKGRALGVNAVKFKGEVLKNVKMATYEIDMKKILVKENTTVGLANGILKADGNKIYSAENLKKFINLYLIQNQELHSVKNIKSITLKVIFTVNQILNLKTILIEKS